MQMKNYKEERTISDGSGGRGAKEWHLGPIGISSRIGHGEDARTSVPEEGVMHWWRERSGDHLTQAGNFHL